MRDIVPHGAPLRTLRSLSLQALEDRALVEAQAGEAESKARSQHAEAIDHAAAEIDGGGFREVLFREGNLPDPEALVDRLRQHRVVEHEIIGVARERKRFDDASPEPAVPGM